MRSADGFLCAARTPWKFLVGPNKLDARKDDTPGGVFVERCRFLEETNCKVSHHRDVVVLLPGGSCRPGRHCVCCTVSIQACTILGVGNGESTIRIRWITFVRKGARYPSPPRIASRTCACPQPSPTVRCTYRFVIGTVHQHVQGAHGAFLRGNSGHDDGNGARL